MIKSLLRCLILIGILGSIGLSAESSLQTIDVFPFGMNAVKSYRIPGVVVTSKGIIVLQTGVKLKFIYVDQKTRAKRGHLLM